jgi:hypothetical protein
MHPVARRLLLDLALPRLFEQHRQRIILIHPWLFRSRCNGSALPPPPASEGK